MTIKLGGKYITRDGTKVAVFGQTSNVGYNWIVREDKFPYYAWLVTKNGFFTASESPVYSGDLVSEAIEFTYNLED